MDKNIGVERTTNFVCTRIGLKILLDAAGCECIGVNVNKYNPKMYVWVYKRTPQLTKVVDNFVESVSLKKENDVNFKAQ